jgi:hypothetical protein
MPPAWPCCWWTPTGAWAPSTSSLCHFLHTTPWWTGCTRQIQGQGFEGKDFETFWKPFGPEGGAAVVDVPFETGRKSVRLRAGSPAAGIRQGRVYLEAGKAYDGYVWLKPESGSPRVTFRVVGSDGKQVAETSLRVSALVSEGDVPVQDFPHNAAAQLRAPRRGAGELLSLITRRRGASGATH